MIKAVHKFYVCAESSMLAGSYKVDMPRGAEILKVGRQGGRLVLWAKADTDVGGRVERLIHVLGTGMQFLDRDVGVYIATVEVAPYVWHLFDGGER